MNKQVMEQHKEVKPTEQRAQVKPQKMDQAQTQAIQIIQQIPFHLIIVTDKVTPNKLAENWSVNL